MHPHYELLNKLEFLRIDGRMAQKDLVTVCSFSSAGNYSRMVDKLTRGEYNRALNASTVARIRTGVLLLTLAKKFKVLPLRQYTSTFKLEIAIKILKDVFDYLNKLSEAN